MHPDFAAIYRKFIKQYGKEKGKKYYYAWLNKHNLDDTKPYRNSDQLQECTTGLCESFRWIDEPLMQFYKHEEDATLWKTVALTANVSQNNNDYSANMDEFRNTASSLSWRPLNWNHDHSLQLPFPENRTELARYEDNAVETIIRIDNNQRHYETGKLVNDMIKDGDILHVSIEGTPRGAEKTEHGVAPRYWHFTGLALLEKDVTLPGDPLTRIEPLFLNESMGRTLVESLMENGREEEDMTENKQKKKDEDTPDPLANLSEEYTGVNGIDQCGQCRYFIDLENTTVKITDVGEQDSSVITRTSGGIGAGVGICQVATQLEGKTKYVRKNDAVCTDGRPRDAPTDADRIKEEKTLEEIEKETMKNDYEKQLNEKEILLFEETKKANSEREEKLKALGRVSEQANTLKKKEAEIANLTAENTRLKNERAELRVELDKLREEISGLKVKIDAKDADIKHYKDRYDSYERTHRELSNEVIMLKEQLSKTIAQKNEESNNRAEANQRARNAEEERARYAVENAALTEKVSTLQREIYDSAKLRAETSKAQMRDYQKLQEALEDNKRYIEEIRVLKQRINKRPSKIKVKG